jgi:hypothetical protein
MTINVKRLLISAGTAVLTGALLLPTSPAAAAPASTATAPSKVTPAAACGTWVLQQIGSAADLDRQAADIKRALAVPGVTGFSMRVPWSAIDKDLTLLDKGRALATGAKKKFSIRFMAGRYTPKRVFDAGAYSYVAATGDRMPKPFSNTGAAGNPVFEREFDAVVARLVNWARNNSVSLVHLPWYGYLWAEIYHGEDLQATSGYSYAAWLAAHKKLVQLAYARAGNGVAVEFALSGHWGGRNTGSTDVSNAIVGVAGTWSRYMFVQGNGLGRFNNKATSREIYHAKQMYDGGNYDWTAMYRNLYDNDERYVEIYTSSFSLTGAKQLATEAQRFASTRC